MSSQNHHQQHASTSPPHPPTTSTTTGPDPNPNPASKQQPPQTPPPSGCTNTLQTIWLKNKGIFLILLAQVAGSCMDAIARFLQQSRGGGGSGGEGKEVVAVHPFQIIFARMSITFLLSSLYMWFMSVPDFPLGKRSARGWLLLRASFGFAGLFCLYYSVGYLPLAENTVLRFLVPIVTAVACALFLGQTFTRKDLIAGLVALLGVVIIAHPESIFGRAPDDGIKSNKAKIVDDVTPTQRLIAIAVSLLGVFFASAAYTMIRVIGDRAHALISVNYFAILASIGSAIALLAIPDIGFVMPADALEWILLILLGVLGFVLQFLLTAGLQLDKSSKATSMLYTQVLFALAFDWAVWGVLPDVWSCVGGAIVIASTLWSALQKPQKKTEEPRISVVDEETALLGTEADGDDEVVQRRASISA